MRLTLTVDIITKKLARFSFLRATLKSKILFFILRSSAIDMYLKKEDLNFVSKVIKLNTLLRFDNLVDIAVVDFPEKLYRFKIIYQFLSLKNNFRITLNTFVKEATFVNTLKNIFPAAD